jgi:four helix bundle protein
MKNFEELEVWKEARSLRIEIAKVVRKFPSEERFRLADQLIRSSRSVCANIAEGFGRFHFQENIQFCRQARGSLLESLDHIICAEDEGFISSDTVKGLRDKIEIVLKLLNGYILYLKKAKADYNNQ